MNPDLMIAAGLLGIAAWLFVAGSAPRKVRITGDAIALISVGLLIWAAWP